MACVTCIDGLSVLVCNGLEFGNGLLFSGGFYFSDGFHVSGGLLFGSGFFTLQGMMCLTYMLVPWLFAPAHIPGLQLLQLI
jgi:hypothetical protein